MKLTKRKGNGIYMVRFVDASGAVRRVSTGERDLAAAQQAALAIVGGAPSRGEDKAASGLTLGDAFRRLQRTEWAPGQIKSLRSLNYLLSEVLADRLGSMEVRAISDEELEQFVARLRAKGNKPATINRKLSVVSKALRAAMKWRHPGTHRSYLVRLPTIPWLTENNRRERVLTAAEEAAVFAEVDRRRATTLARGARWTMMGALLRVLVETGMRLGEALQLERGQVADGFVTLRAAQTKTSRPRSIPLTAAAADALALVGAMHAAPRLFAGIDRHRAAHLWDEVRQVVPGIEDVTLHTLRHTCATRLLEAGWDLYSVALWLGHSSVKITEERYAHLQRGHLTKGVELLERRARVQALGLTVVAGGKAAG